MNEEKEEFHEYGRRRRQLKLAASAAVEVEVLQSAACGGMKSLKAQMTQMTTDIYGCHDLCSSYFICADLC